MALINKPWGNEEILEKNKHYLLKKLQCLKIIDVAFNIIIKN